MDQPYVGDVGTAVELTIVGASGITDVSAAVVTLTFVRPDGTMFSVAAANSTTGRDGKVFYRTRTGDLSQPGKWAVGAEVTIPAAGYVWKTNLFVFLVSPSRL